MGDPENARAQQEALHAADRPGSSRRDAIWAGLTRYLSSESMRMRRPQPKPETPAKGEPKPKQDKPGHDDSSEGHTT